MNCRPGDRAFIVKADSPFERQDLGKVVLVIEVGDDWSDVGDSRHYWVCRAANGGLLAYFNDHDGSLGYSHEIEAPDECLRPIRDQPGADETLSWAPLPQPMTERQEA